MQQRIGKRLWEIPKAWAEKWAVHPAALVIKLQAAAIRFGTFSALLGLLQGKPKIFFQAWRIGRALQLNLRAVFEITHDIRRFGSGFGAGGPRGYKSRDFAQIRFKRVAVLFDGNGCAAIGFAAVSTGDDGALGVACDRNVSRAARKKQYGSKYSKNRKFGRSAHDREASEIHKTIIEAKIQYLRFICL